jgi:hypothetical protein
VILALDIGDRRPIPMYLEEFRVSRVAFEVTVICTTVFHRTTRKLERMRNA